MRGFTMSERAFNEAERAVNYMINQKSKYKRSS